MSLFSLGRKYRGLQRLRRVAEVLFKHGFGSFVERLDLRRYIPLPGKWKHVSFPREPMAMSRSFARHAAEAMEELGPTFVKLGQFLSTRPDLLPPVYLEEFAKLQDSVEPFSSAEARGVIEEALGGAIEDFFSDFEDEPIASGSIAQVHRGVTTGGEQVVVKVRRPGIPRVIASDLDLLRMFARRLEEYVPESRVMQPRMLVDELSRHLMRELDFLQEASSTQKFHAAFAESDRFYGPKVFWDLTTTSILTLERLSGRGISAFVSGGTPEEKKQLAVGLFDLYMKQFFEIGFFHADPHPGNILVDERLRINVIDFGLTGHISDELQGALGTGILALRMGDIDLMMGVLEDLKVFTDITDTSQVRGDIISMMDTYVGMPLGRIDMPTMFGKIISIAQRNTLLLPRDFVMMGKALVTVAGLARALDEDFDAVGALGPYVRTLIRKKFSFESLRKSFLSMAFHSANLIRYAPADLRRIVRKLLSGELSVNFQHRGLEKLIFDLDRSSNRLAFSIVVGSLVIASSLMLSMGVKPLVFGVPLLGLSGYLLAAVLGLWLIWAILRSGRL